MTRILLLATGGTIASVQGEDGLAPGLTPQELLQALPELPPGCQVDTETVLDLDSTNIQPRHWLQLAGAIQARYTDYDAFVVTHGTDTMAYTAAALSYLIQGGKKPIVLTGAQLPIWAGGSDAPKNLLDSFFFCSRTDTGGVYVVFGGKAILGTRARKVRTMSYSAFDSINYPPAASIHHRQITSYFLAPPQADALRFYGALCPDVCLLKLAPGTHPAVLQALGEHCDGLILESFGSGGLPFHFHDTVSALTELGKIIVLGTQVTFEGSDLDVYEVGGRLSGQTGVLQTYDMTTEAALAKLMWLLPQAASPDDARRLFYTPVCRDIYLPK